MKLERLGKAITDAYVAPSLSISDEQARALAAYPQVHVDVTALQAALDEKKRLEAYLRNKGLGEIIGS